MIPVCYVVKLLGNERERIVFHASILCPLLACVNISFAVCVMCHLMLKETGHGSLGGGIDRTQTAVTEAMPEGLIGQ